MSYDVKTPVLVESIEAARMAISGVTTGSLEPKQASIVVGGARALQGAVNTDIKARLAAPKIAAAEARIAAQQVPVAANAA